MAHGGGDDRGGLRLLIVRKMLRRGDWVVAMAGTTTRSGTNMLRILQQEGRRISRGGELTPPKARPIIYRYKKKHHFVPGRV